MSCSHMMDNTLDWDSPLPEDKLEASIEEADKVREDQPSNSMELSSVGGSWFIHPYTLTLEA